jgi:glycosyltransferase involved in cell wall biosynthesis
MRSLRSLGHAVDIAVIAPGPLLEIEADFPGTQSHLIASPGLVRVAINILRRFLTGSMSLNESLFWSPSVAREVTELIVAGSYDLAIGDMVRAAPSLVNLPVPVVLDLDDRLSERYRALRETGGDTADLLGIYGPRIPRAIRPAVVRCAQLLLAREAGVLHDREIALARSMTAVSMVSASEAASLERDSGVRVCALPMAVTPAAFSVDVAGNRGDSMVFSGGLDYHANLEAIRWFADAVLPEIIRARPGFSLTVIGVCPPAVRVELERPGLVFLGYVENLEVELARHRAFLAPLRSGTGIKTKVLEAMGVGLPVVTTSFGITGLEVVPGEQCLVDDSAAGLAGCAARLADDSEAAARLGDAGRGFVQANFADSVITARWDDLLLTVIPGLRGAAQTPAPV